MQKSHILIVDDDKDIVSAIDTILQMEDYEVIKAYTGEDSIRQARKYKPDLILLDYMLPDMNGNKVVEILREKEKCDVPIILISAAHNVKELAKKMAVNACITKPFALEDLLDSVARYTNS